MRKLMLRRFAQESDVGSNKVDYFLVLEDVDTHETIRLPVPEETIESLIRQSVDVVEKEPESTEPVAPPQMVVHDDTPEEDEDITEATVFGGDDNFAPSSEEEVPSL